MQPLRYLFLLISLLGCGGRTPLSSDSYGGRPIIEPQAVGELYSEYDSEKDFLHLSIWAPYDGRYTFFESFIQWDQLKITTKSETADFQTQIHCVEMASEKCIQVLVTGFPVAGLDLTVEKRILEVTASDRPETTLLAGFSFYSDLIPKKFIFADKKDFSGSELTIEFPTLFDHHQLTQSGRITLHVDLPLPIPFYEMKCKQENESEKLHFDCLFKEPNSSVEIKKSWIVQLR